MIKPSFGCTEETKEDSCNWVDILASGEDTKLFKTNISAPMESDTVDSIPQFANKSKELCGFTFMSIGIREMTSSEEILYVVEAIWI